ncbi:Rieske [2Fe-2S] domain-containing protein [Desulfopila aestuarii DSM 18488]|uniref:Rieske [2Fe-2S] domain-containing protein n=2 Tax=Desulfopila aestuarii TaxID=231440 RepID=A0A1M7Y9I5_9BACT|nr:Rieske [2Fe-2S] domain-containing protein [Desulfopila aestuarii DSM 18488]
MMTMTRIKPHPQTQDVESSATRPPVPPINRRHTIIGILALAVATLLGSLGRMAMSFILPPKPVNSYGGIVDVGPLTQLPAPGSPPKQIPHGRFWLIHTDKGILALHSSCTHLECFFGWDSEQQLFICPCHGSTFNLDGQVLRGPAQRNLDRFPVRLVQVDGTIVRDSNTKAMAVRVADLLFKENAQSNPGIDTPTALPILVQVDTGQKIVSP